MGKSRTWKAIESSFIKPSAMSAAVCVLGLMSSFEMRVKRKMGFQQVPDGLEHPHSPGENSMEPQVGIRTRSTYVPQLQAPVPVWQLRPTTGLVRGSDSGSAVGGSPLHRQQPNFKGCWSVSLHGSKRPILQTGVPGASSGRTLLSHSVPWLMDEAAGALLRALASVL